MDYRRVDLKDAYNNVLSKKKSLLAEMTIGRKIQNHYLYIRKRSSIYNEKFLAIYNYTCVYCGANHSLISRTDWEIDHFICESSFKKLKNGQTVVDHCKAGNIYNLVLACSNCNNVKLGFVIDDSLQKILDIDNNGITNVFCRDENTYRIIINDNYKQNQDVVEFYKKLNLGSELKRVSYMLMKIDFLLDNSNISQPKRKILEEIYRLLLKKRNLTYEN